MGEPDQLMIPHQVVHRSLLPGSLVAVDIVQNFGVEDEKAPINPPFPFFGLLVERGDMVFVNGHSSEASRRPNRGYCCQLPMRLVVTKEVMEVHIRDSVAVGE